MEKVVHGNLDLHYLLQALKSLVMNMKITMTELQLKKEKEMQFVEKTTSHKKEKQNLKPNKSR